MPHLRRFDRDYYQRPYSPPPQSTTSTLSSDPYASSHRAVQPYRYDSPPRHRSDDPRALQPSRPRSYSRDRAVARRRSDSTLGPSTTKASRTDQGTTWLKDNGAPLLGAAAGGLAGRKSGHKDDHLRTAGGAAVGAIGGKVLERQYRKWNHRREDKKVGREVRRGYDSESEDSYDDEYSPPPRRRSSRSLDRGRGRTRSPTGWRDVGRRIQRSLSRKRAGGRDGR